jgi:hypothetical protein
MRGAPWATVTTKIRRQTTNKLEGLDLFDS